MADDDGNATEAAMEGPPSLASPASAAAARRPAYFASTSLDQMAAGLAAGAVSTAVLQPLDVVKTRLQGTPGATHAPPSSGC